jgi:hypothetical protein
MTFITPDEERIRRFAIDIAFVLGFLLGLVAGYAWRLV